jgi:molecular chaperone HtpG
MKKIELSVKLKEGVSSDYENKERILSLLLFQSPADPEKLTTLKGYVERIREGQDEIYYLTGESRGVVKIHRTWRRLRRAGTKRCI